MKEGAEPALADCYGMHLNVPRLQYFDGGFVV
jgi:hypothetical protein